MLLPRQVLYYGRDVELPEPVVLQAGPLALTYENGDLRYIRLGDCEILRRIYVAVRDRNWGTVPPVLSDLQVNHGRATSRSSTTSITANGRSILAGKA